MNNLIDGSIQLKNEVTNKNDILVLNDYWFYNIDKLKIKSPKAIISPCEYAFSHIPSFIQMMGIPLMFLNANSIAQLKDNQHVYVDFANNSVSIDLPLIHATQKDELLSANGISFYSSIKGEKIDFSLINQSDGVGLISTEFLFYQSKNISKKYQFGVLNEICAQNPDLEYTIRLFDIGIDKIPIWAHNKYSNMNGSNGRVKEHISVADNANTLLNQLFVIEELSKTYKISLLVPYLTDIDEILKIKAILNRHLSENICLGAMIENLDIMSMIEDLNNVVDFYSLGTNDIIQSFFKIDRTKPICFNEINLKDEKFLIVLSDILNRVQGKSIRVCGQLPIIPDMLPKLIEIGYKNFTVNPCWVKYLKSVASNCIT